MIPWFIVGGIDRISWWFGYQVYVTATGGPGWHRGRIGADRIHFVRRGADSKRVPKLKAANWWK